MWYYVYHEYAALVSSNWHLSSWYPCWMEVVRSAMVSIGTKTKMEPIISTKKGSLLG